MLSFSNKQDPLQERARYREQSLRAAALGKIALARCWRLALDEVEHVIQQEQSSFFLSPQTTPFLHQTALLIHSNQEGNYHFDQHNNDSFSPHWAFTRDENQEPTSCYRYWLAITRASTSKNLEQEINQTSTAASHYHDTFPEVAYFAKTATTCFQKARDAQHQFAQNHSIQHEFLIHRWKRAAYEAASLAALLLQEKDHILAHQQSCQRSWRTVITLAEQALSLRIQASEATEKNEEEQAIHYSLAARAAAASTKAAVKLLTFSEKKKEEHLLQHILHVTQKISCYRRKSSEMLLTSPQNAAHWDRIAFWLENSWEGNVYALEAQVQHADYPLLSLYWKKSSQASAHTATCLATIFSFFPVVTQVAHCKTFGKCIHYLENRARKKIPIPFLEKISFCLTEHFLPIYEWRKQWEEDQPIHFDARSKSPTVTSWIYQTWSFLKKAGVNCHLSTSFPSDSSEGIYITLTKLLKPTINRSPSSPLFLVDILADGTPHAAANFHLVENRAYASYLPFSLFVPHWPQPFLKPRDPSRGIRFENICFFGEIQNLAPELRSDEWRQRLEKELGLYFKIRESHEWSDYSDIDCVVAIRDFSTSLHLNKPATKLYNAWLAGVPFIGGRDAAYAADGHPGQDYLVATSLEELFQHLKHLQENLSFRTQLLNHGTQSGQAFTKEATLARWKMLLQETLPVRALKWQQLSTRQRSWFFFLQRVICWFHHSYFFKKGAE